MKRGCTWSVLQRRDQQTLRACWFLSGKMFPVSPCLSSNPWLAFISHSWRRAITPKSQFWLIYAQGQLPSSSGMDFYIRLSIISSSEHPLTGTVQPYDDLITDVEHKGRCMSAPALVSVDHGCKGRRQQKVLFNVAYGTVESLRIKRRSLPGVTACCNILLEIFTLLFLLFTALRTPLITYSPAYSPTACNIQY